MFLEDGAAGLNRIDDAVGQAAGFHCGQESIDDFVPGSIFVGHKRVSIAIGQDFRIALANRNEEHHAGATRSRRDDADGKFAMRQLARMYALHFGRYEAHSDRHPVERQRQCNEKCAVDDETGLD